MRQRKMRSKKHFPKGRYLALAMAAAVLFASQSSTLEAAKSVSQLEDEKDELQDEIDALDSQLVNLLTEVDELEAQISQKQQEISDTQAELEAAEEAVQQQYEDMKVRIQYMYENGNTTAFVQMEDGMNERGLAAGLTFVYPKVRAAGLNAGMLVRLLLEKCTAAEEALALLEKVPCASQHTVTVADGGGNIFVAECSPRKLHVIRPQCSRAVAAVNNFFSPEMHALANPPELDDWNAAGRYAASIRRPHHKRVEKPHFRL